MNTVPVCPVIAPERLTNRRVGLHDQADNPGSDPRGGSDQAIADAGLEADFKPLDAQQAQAGRARQPVVSPWQVLWLQGLAGILLTALAALIGGTAVAWSAFWGVLAVWLPAAVFARALARQMRLRQAGVALLGLMVWEGVKVALTVALLLLAPLVVEDLDWLALLAGFVVTIKVYWLAWWLAGRRR